MITILESFLLGVAFVLDLCVIKFFIEWGLLGISD